MDVDACDIVTLPVPTSLPVSVPVTEAPEPCIIFPTPIFSHKPFDCSCSNCPVAGEVILTPSSLFILEPICGLTNISPTVADFVTTAAMFIMLFGATGTVV